MVTSHVRCKHGMFLCNVVKWNRQSGQNFDLFTSERILLSYKVLFLTYFGPKVRLVKFVGGEACRPNPLHILLTYFGPVKHVIVNRPYNEFITPSILYLADNRHYNGFPCTDFWRWVHLGAQIVNAGHVTSMLKTRLAEASWEAVKKQINRYPEIVAIWTLSTFI